MSEWHQLIQTLIDETDACIRKRESDLLTLSTLSRKLGYSEDTLSRILKKGFWRSHWTMAFPATKPSPVPLRKPTA